MKYTDLAQDYFERHSTSDECHISSDGRVFHTFGYATSYTQEHDLKIQEIESYKRSDVEQKKDAEIEPENDAEILEKFKNTDIENADYNDLKLFAKHFKIETEDQKAATLKTALNNFKNTLNTAE